MWVTKGWSGFRGQELVRKCPNISVNYCDCDFYTEANDLHYG